MAGSSTTSETRYQVRSISLPSRSHPSTLQIEEELNKLKSWEILSSPLKAERILVGLSDLGGLYNCVEDLLQLPLTQQALGHLESEKWADELLDGSVRLLDICSTMRDMLIQMKEQVLDLQSALRRRRGRESSAESKLGDYISSKKKMKKEIAKCLAALKQMHDKFESSSLLLHLDHHLSTVVRVLREVSLITVSIFQSLLSFMSGPISKPKPTKWSLVSKLMHKRLVACESTEDNMIEVERVDIALHGLYSQVPSKDEEGKMVQIAQKRLKSLEFSIEGLEDGLMCMFRHLVQTRVSLLNVLTH